RSGTDLVHGENLVPEPQGCRVDIAHRLGVLQLFSLGRLGQVVPDDCELGYRLHDADSHQVLNKPACIVGQIAVPARLTARVECLQVLGACSLALLVADQYAARDIQGGTNRLQVDVV